MAKFGLFNLFGPGNPVTTFYISRDFTNVLRAAFMLLAPKSVRIQSQCQYLFTLLRSTGAKAARRTLMKLNPGVSPMFYVQLLRS